MGGDGHPSCPRQGEKEPSSLLSVFGKGSLCIRHAGSIEARTNGSPARVIPHGATCCGSWEVCLTPNSPVPGKLLLTTCRTGAPVTGATGLYGCTGLSPGCRGDMEHVSRATQNPGARCNQHSHASHPRAESRTCSIIGTAQKKHLSCIKLSATGDWGGSAESVPSLQGALVHTVTPTSANNCPSPTEGSTYLPFGFLLNLGLKPLCPLWLFSYGVGTCCRLSSCSLAGDVKLSWCLAAAGCCDGVTAEAVQPCTTSGGCCSGLGYFHIPPVAL